MVLLEIKKPTHWPISSFHGYGWAILLGHTVSKQSVNNLTGSQQEPSHFLPGGGPSVRNKLPVILESWMSQGG